MRRILVPFIFVAAAGLVPRAIRAQQPRPRSSRFFDVDSLSLERLRGYWWAPTYTIVVTRSDRVIIRPDSVAQSLFHVPATTAGVFHDLMVRVSFAFLDQLPDTLQHDPVFGAVCGTDASTAVVTVYRPDRVTRVVDYQGCMWAPAIIRDLERAIDKAAGRLPDK